jgi:hypothetical protein
MQKLRSVQTVENSKVCYRQPDKPNNLWRANRPEAPQSPSNLLLNRAGGRTSNALLQNHSPINLNPVGSTHMKLLLSIVLLFGASVASHAAITIAITPGVSGTSFSVTQTSPNPLIALGATTVGYVAGVAIAPVAFDQDIGSIGFVDTFSPHVGTLTDLYGGASGNLVGFSFFFDSGTGSYRGFQPSAPVPIVRGSILGGWD